MSGFVELDALRLDLLGRLLLATVLGAAVGIERESTGKEAGLRTTILICLGAALFTDLSSTLASSSSDGTRITANIVTGIGFLGAGAILQKGGHVKGLTSAATIWVVAAIGVASGGGQYVAAIGTTLLVLLVLVPLRRWERRWERRADARAPGDEHHPPEEEIPDRRI
jgi:putative Mg2+ transporter-C (MgtC) family protein